MPVRMTPFSPQQPGLPIPSLLVSETLGWRAESETGAAHTQGTGLRVTRPRIRRARPTYHLHVLTYGP